MAKDIIAFFSSDARELYKADILRSLALPKGYVIHFRYLKKYIHPSFLQDILNSKNRPGIIFYLSGNDPNLQEDQRTLTTYPIRDVIIKDYSIDENIETVHFYLELGEFSSDRPYPETKEELLPPSAFVSPIRVEGSPNYTWLDRVKDIENDFENRLFFHINGLKHNKKFIKPIYSKYDRASHFELCDESEYQVEFTIYDPSGGVSGLSAENSDSYVNLVIPSGYRVGAERDTEIFNLFTHSLNRQKLIGFSYLESRSSDNQVANKSSIDYSVALRWHVKRGPHKPIFFGLFSALIALGFFGGKFITMDLKTTNIAVLNIFIGLILLACVGVGAGFLFHLFNKK